ncbi:probable disease resistance protein At5g63020 [Hevea brasiliensis]|uniref:probable disease resistance protein At5g63020 n=1 Tax=Hevea brasiliensis TaxID=3981 RepID=UPI0025D40504|nr:probable disease resistance protein At5g63020 [Hevea brasiliensis]
MGNMFQIQCGDALIGRCWDCITGQAFYVCQLQDNLKALNTASDQLRDLRNDVMRMIINEQRPQTVQLDQVGGWLSRVDAVIAEVNTLLSKSTQETQKMCLAGCCSRNCYSSYIFGKSVAGTLEHVVGLMAEGDFKEVVIRAPAFQLQDDLEALKTARQELWALKEDVKRKVALEEGQQKKALQQVQLWLTMAEVMVTEAEELERDGPQQIQKLLVGDISNYMFVGRVAKKLEDLIALKAKGDFKELVERTLPDPVVVRNYKPTVGTETTLGEAWSCLMEDEVGIVGIYGMGGVGKTTLLTQINNMFATTPNNFDLVIWAVVSKDLKPEKIQEQIWKNIGFFDEKWERKSLREKGDDIFHVLSRKKFVLLLDDIWQRVDLGEIGVALPTRQNKSKIVFTTRSRRVGRQMDAEKMIKVKPLEWEKAWALFQLKVGCIDPNFLPLAQDVAKKCRGLPIALITIGHAMASRNTVEEWKHALEVLRSSASSSQGMEDEVFQEMEVEVFSLLKFSYDSLRSDKVKSCFLYCSLFPEDFKIIKDELADYWIYENFCSRNEAYSIIGSLVGVCLLEEEGQCVKMHDVIRDMAVWIACKCEKEKHKFFVKAGSQLIEVPDVGEWEGSRRMSLMANSFKGIHIFPRCPDLFTLFLSANHGLCEINDNFFQFMDALTVLDLSSTGINELPKGISKLNSLQYLNLSRTCIKQLPVGISKLNSLQYLNLSRTCVKQLPVELKMLVNLKHLNLEYNIQLNVIPRGVISSLSSLQVLRMFNIGLSKYRKGEDNILGEDIMLIEELQCLEHLNELNSTVGSVSALQSFISAHTLLNCTRGLRLELFQGPQSLNVWWLANMKNLGVLQIFGDIDSEELDVDVVMEETETHNAAGGLGSSVISREACFNSLHTLIVSGNLRLRDLTWLILAPNLTNLSVFVNKHIEEIISVKKFDDVEVLDENSNPFLKLQVLSLNKLPVLKSIYPKALSFPFLEQIEVYKCPQLKKLPLNSSSAKGCKVVIEAEEKWWKDVEWEDDSTKTTFLPCFVPSHRRY